MSGLDANEAVGTICSISEAKSERPSLVEIKKGKVLFKQKCISFEKQSETLQEIVKFREMLEDYIKRQAPPLATIPDEHRPLVAKLAHESDKSFAALVKHIRQELLPVQDVDEECGSSSSGQAVLPLSAIEAAVKTILHRNNYGLDGIGGGKAPAAVCVWRWEVKEQYRDWLPKSGREKAEARLAERVQAKQDLRKIFDSLSQQEQDSILDPKGTGKLPPKEIKKPNPPNVPNSTDLASEEIQISPRGPKKPSGEIEIAENNTQSDCTMRIPSRAKKPADPEKAAKEKEKLERKAAKAEKEKKEKDAQNKSRSLMANFFGKRKPPTRSPSKEVESSDAGPSDIHSEFEKSFKPFVQKKDVHVAPVNWFLEHKQSRKKWPAMDLDDEVIIIDGGESLEERDGIRIDGTPPEELNVSEMSAQEHLRSILSTLQPCADPLRRRLPHPRLKTCNPVAVRDIVSKLSEAEIAGDISLVRSLLSKLCDRSLLPAKVFIFTEDARPGYFGTWSRSSRIIGPRTPFAKDVVVFDYAYDSGEEWEEEAAGEADDVVEDGEDEDGDGEDADSDLDSWLVDDDDEPQASLDDSDIAPPLIPNVPIQAPKRKAEEGAKKLGKKRKIVIPLVPFARGPCWESSIGHCEYDLLKPYRMQMFNDTPFPIDPFTFVSMPVDDAQGNTRGTPSSDSVFAVPSLPGRLAAPNPAVVFSDSPTSAIVRKTTLTPKTRFPDAHLPFLLGKITALQTVSITFLVEAIYQELRVHKVKKNAIEAKVREVGEKSKEKKVWVVKPEVEAHQP